jgi:hypothetical protein
LRRGLFEVVADNDSDGGVFGAKSGEATDRENKQQCGKSIHRDKI